MQALPTTRLSPVYYDFLTTFLNKNTWLFNDVVLNQMMNCKAVFQLVMKRCKNLRELILYSSTEIGDFLSSPTLNNLVHFHCTSINFDDRMLLQISGMEHIR